MLVFLRNNVKRSLIDWAAYLATVVTLITLLEYIHYFYIDQGPIMSYDVCHVMFAITNQLQVNIKV